MTATEVKRLLAQEVAGEGSRVNAHGCVLQECLVEPVRVIADGGFELWIVLEEYPETKQGYKVVLEEEVRTFGLALPNGERLIYLGRYGSFLETFDAM